MPSIESRAISQPASANTSTGTVRTSPLEVLSDEEYLATSHEFGEQYGRLLDGSIDPSSEMAVSVRTAAAPYLNAIEGMDDKTTAATLIEGFREGYNKLFVDHGYEPPFASPEVTEEDLDHVKRVGRTEHGIPILYTDDNENLFQHDTFSFASPEVLMEQGLPPLVVVNEGISDREQVAIHESSHAIWRLMVRAGMIPEASGQQDLSVHFALDTARDEAVAMQMAGQGKIIHPNVIKSLKKEGFPEESIERYRTACYRYAEAMQGAQGIEQRDSALGFMYATTWDEFFNHVDRMTTIAEAAPHDKPQKPAPEVSGYDAWSSV